MAGAASSSTDVLVDFAPPAPPEAVARAEAFARAQAEGAAPVTPRRSASVVLLRDARAGIEVHLLHRQARMPFAPSVAAFAGGGVDAADSSAADPVVACALRETTEETGVRLLPADLAPWARWITPVYEPRRHDTSFFLARLPDGQQARDVSGETDRTDWIRPVDALAAREAGRLALMPPTWAVLRELVDLPDVTAALAVARGRVVATVLPRLVRSGDRWAFAYEVVG